MPLIIVDAGHGGKDKGAVWGFTEEDDINLSVAYFLQYELRLAGFDAILTRIQDVYMSLPDRVQFANDPGASLFVSVHCDAYHNTTVRGISTHVYPDCSMQSRIIARKVQDALIFRYPSHINRQVKKSNFYVLRETVMPAILVECEFLSNPETRKFLQGLENQLGLAQAISEGIASCYVETSA